MRLLLLLILASFPFSAAFAGEWQLVKEDEKAAIRVFTRAVDGSDLKEFRGELRVHARLSSLVALVEDNSNGPHWLHLCKALELIEQYSPQQKLFYMVSDAPWPVTDRDSVFMSTLMQDDSGEVIIRMASRADDFPANDDYIRITRMTGFWQFVPQNDGGVLVVYQVHAEPGGGIPSWLSNSVVVDNPYYTLLNMAQEVKKPQYRDAQLAHVREPHSH